MADWTDEEKSRKISIWAKPFDATWRPKGGKALRLVMLDTPGYADFYGQVVGGDAGRRRRAARRGRHRRRAGRHRPRLEALRGARLPRAIAITGLDKENADFAGTVAALQDVWGARCEVVTFPTDDKKGVVDALSAQGGPRTKSAPG
jgi:translation elongation factor EF-G